MSRASLQKALAEGRQVFAPCAYDALSAKALELCGFDGVLLSGGAMSYQLGVWREEDYSADEMIHITETVANAVNIPVIVDAAGGHGESPTAVYRNVRRLALAGAAAMTIDDGDGDFDFTGSLPFRGKAGKRGPKDMNVIMEPFAQAKPMFGGMRSFRPVLERKAYLEKIHAAVEACKGTDCMIIARTECYDTYGFDEVVERINDCRKLGAKMWTVCLGMWSEQEGKMFSEALGGWSMWPDVVSMDHKPNVPMDHLKDMGFNLVTCHIAEKAAMYGMAKYGKNIFDTHSAASIDNAVVSGISQETARETLRNGRGAAENLDKQSYTGNV